MPMRKPQPCDAFPIMTRGTPTRSLLMYRRGLLQRGVSATGLLALSGCDVQYTGTGPDPSGKLPFVAAGLFGISLDFYADDTVRLNADWRKFVLHGLFFVGSIPSSVVAAGCLAVEFIDHYQQESFLVGVASSAVSDVIAQKVIHPAVDFQVDITQFRRESRTIELQFEESNATIARNEPVATQPSMIRGRWYGYSPRGLRIEYSFEPDSNGTKIRSSEFTSDGYFRFEKKSTIDSALVLNGTAMATFRNDPAQKQRTSAMTFRCINDREIDAETTYFEIDKRGKVARERWWPFRLSRVS